METPSKPSVVKTITSLSRVPLLLLVCGLVSYGVVRAVAPSVDPADLTNVIGLAAVLAVVGIEAVLRLLKRKKESQRDEN